MYKKNVESITSKSVIYMKWNIIQPQKEKKKTLLPLVATQKDKHYTFGKLRSWLYRSMGRIVFTIYYLLPEKGVQEANWSKMVAHEVKVAVG